eukprot:4124057-Prymnesium_polylepis.1
MAAAAAAWAACTRSSISLPLVLTVQLQERCDRFCGTRLASSGGPGDRIAPQQRCKSVYGLLS